MCDFRCRGSIKDYNKALYVARCATVPSKGVIQFSLIASKEEKEKKIIAKVMSEQRKCLKAWMGKDGGVLPEQESL